MPAERETFLSDVVEVLKILLDERQDLQGFGRYVGIIVRQSSEVVFGIKLFFFFGSHQVFVSDVFIENCQISNWK